MDGGAQRSVVAERDIERARLTVFAAPESVAVAREPFIEAIGKNANEGNAEQPSDQLSLWQNI